MIPIAIECQVQMLTRNNIWIPRSRKAVSLPQVFDVLPPQSWPPKRCARPTWVKQASRDPLDSDIWDSWQAEEDDWDTERFTENELIDILFEVSPKPA